MTDTPQAHSAPALVMKEGTDGEDDAYTTWYPEFAGRKVLLAEDAPVHAKQVYDVLIAAGCEVVDVFTNGDDALEAALNTPYDVLLLDVVMPGVDGPELLRKVRAGTGPNRDAIAVFLTAATDARLRREAISVTSEIRAEDFLVKPVEDEELIARIGEHLERRNWTEQKSQYVNGPLVVETSPPRVTIAGNPIRLTQRRFDVLLLLIKHCGRPVTRQMIAIAGWRTAWAKNGYLIDKARDDSISALVFQLRKLLKVEAPDDYKEAFENILVAVACEGLRMTKLDDA